MQTRVPVEPTNAFVQVVAVEFEINRVNVKAVVFKLVAVQLVVMTLEGRDNVLVQALWKLFNEAGAYGLDDAPTGIVSVHGVVEHPAIATGP